MKDFAKILRAPDGRQVLYYVEPDGDDYQVHQVMYVDFGMVDAKITFNKGDAERNEASAYRFFESAREEMAGRLVLAMLELTGADE